MELDSERIDAATEEPPVKWVMTSLVGLLLAAVGLVALALGLLGFAGAVVGAVPLLGLVFDLSVPFLIVGVGLFVVSMTEWESDVEA